MAKPKTVVVTYHGCFATSDLKLIHEYVRQDGGKAICFTKKLPRPFHRIGDRLSLIQEGEGKYRADKVLDHTKSASIEARHNAAVVLVKARREEKRMSEKSDLRDAMRPLIVAYHEESSPGRRALIAWILETLNSGW